MDERKGMGKFARAGGTICVLGLIGGLVAIPFASVAVALTIAGISLVLLLAIRALCRPKP